ncbi:restriction endonuclease subunit S [Streptococcus suis]
MSENVLKNFKLGEVITIFNGTKYDHLNEGNIPLYGSGGLMSYVDDFLYNGKALLLPRKGTLDNIMYVDEAFWTVDTMYYATVNSNEVNDYYLYSYLSILNLAILDSGSTLPSMTKTAYQTIDILLPTKVEQDKVARLLFVLDQKIAINNQINEELEAMAKTLYDYWFVQFDFPDENGNPYKSSGGKMVYNDQLKREIPEGWGVENLSNFLTIKNGKDHKDLSDGNYPVYGSGGLMRKVEDYIFEGESVLIPRKGTLNNIIYVDEKFWTVDTMFYTHMKIDYVALYTYFSIKDIDFTKLNTGTGVPSMTASILYQLQIINPNADVLKNFDELVRTTYRMIFDNRKQNQELNQLREWLLPMLMNGQVKVD